jgi:hypothetical protein
LIDRREERLHGHLRAELYLAPLIFLGGR